jgi:two-component system sensor histidine kinase KdpD
VSVTTADGLQPANLNRGVASRILEELVDNALRFSTAETGVDVTVAAGIGAIEVRVIDEGPGIDPREHERVFGPLEQLEELNVRIHQGAGMGLALARTAARAMGGDVVIETSSGAGSTFLWTIALTS